MPVISRRIAIQVTAVALIAVITSGATPGVFSSVSSADPKLITLDPSYLALAKQRVEANDASVKPAFDALKTRADRALAATPGSVTDKARAPPSGDKHDYMSMGPYWWPNPDTPNKLPYIRKDGQRNPEARDENLDSQRMRRMSIAVRDLALAYYFTGDKAYATKTAEMLRVWFLNSQTRMNPNLRYGQAIPGVVDGRGIGLIETNSLWTVIDATALIWPSGALSARELRGLRGWFAEFAHWMVHSDTGHEEDVWHNNHGMYFDAQLINYLLFIGDVPGAARRTFDAKTRRIASQIARDGRQHMELERTRPFHYSVFNLAGAMRIARYGEQVHVPGMTLKADDPKCVHLQFRCAIDVWNFEASGRSIRSAIDYLTNVTANPKSWTLHTEEEKTLDFDEMVQPLLLAERAYQSGNYAKVLATLPDSTMTAVERLYWPLK